MALDGLSDRYDIMISYSHSDNEICHKIYEHLTNNCYNVWIDIDGMYGSSWEAMARGIQQSDVVLICTSEQYQESTNCKREAQYASQLRKYIVPLIVTKHYRPKDWLGHLLGALNYINFTKLNFNDAYEQMISEIGKQMPDFKPSLTEKTKKVPKKKPPPATSNQKQTSHPQNPPNADIAMWSTQDVQDFLAINKLETIAPILSNTDGLALCELYKIYDRNPDLVYQSLNTQLQETCKITLPITVFTAFVSKLNKIMSTTISTTITTITTTKTVTTSSPSSQASEKKKLTSDSNKKKVYKYDVLIDYTYPDKHIAEKLYEYLMSKNLKVWIDYVELHGDWSDEVTKAVEDSEIIIVCISQRYEKSRLCQKTLEYAAKVERILIPVRVEERYRPQSWLAVLLGNRLYFDIAKDFDGNCEKLLNEINHFRKI